MGTVLELSCRLKAIADMVTKGNRLVDVGCDHGYLPVYLVMNRIIPSAIAADIGKGPLERAKEHIQLYHLEELIETRLCDGLSGIRPGEGDTLVIAGMGGPLMEKILTREVRVRESFSELILQPQSDVPHFRHFLLMNGYNIIEEKMILEQGKFYPMMKAVKYKDSAAGIWTKEEEAYGRLLLTEKNPVLKVYLDRELKIRKEILDRLPEDDKEQIKSRRREVEEEKRIIENALKRYEG